MQPSRRHAPIHAPFALQYLSPAQRAVLRAPVLGEIYFNLTPALATIATAAPSAQVVMEQLQAEPIIEVWTSPTPVRYGHAEGIQFACNEGVLFGCYTQPLDVAAFEPQVSAAYNAVLKLQRAQGYPHLLRLWNYFPHIAYEVGELDRYKRFCRARAAALAPQYGQASAKLPAASAVGSHGGELVIYFMAATLPGHQRENPRQVSAYCYPAQYGPRSPSFARATLTPDAQLLISGTASIVGHESRHIGDVAAQLNETLENLRAVIETTARDEGVGFDGLRSLREIKIYLRNPADYGRVRAQLDALLPAHVARMYLHADICRKELLLEIEGVASAR